MEHDVTIPKGPDVYWKKWIDAYETEAFKQENSPDGEGEISYEDADGFPLDEFSPQIKTILTPFGVLPLTEQSLASSHFKFWVGHTNFKLYDDYYPIIEAIKGVETIGIMTPYRFKLGVGMLFEDKAVMCSVRDILLKANNEFKRED